MFEEIIGSILGGIWKWLTTVSHDVLYDDKGGKGGRLVVVAIYSLFFGGICAGLIYIARDTVAWVVVFSIFALVVLAKSTYWLIRIFRPKK